MFLLGNVGDFEIDYEPFNSYIKRNNGWLSNKAAPYGCILKGITDYGPGIPSVTLMLVGRGLLNIEFINDLLNRFTGKSAPRESRYISKLISAISPSVYAAAPMGSYRVPSTKDQEIVLGEALTQDVHYSLRHKEDKATEQLTLTGVAVIFDGLRHCFNKHDLLLMGVVSNQDANELASQLITTERNPLKDTFAQEATNLLKVS